MDAEEQKKLRKKLRCWSLQAFSKWAGTTDYWEAWVFIAVLLVPIFGG